MVWIRNWLPVTYTTIVIYFIFFFWFGPGVVDWQINVFQFVQDKNLAALLVSANMLVCNTTARLAGVLVAVGLSQSTVV
jgi:hypothetical protein